TGDTLVDVAAEATGDEDLVATELATSVFTIPGYINITGSNPPTAINFVAGPSSGNQVGVDGGKTIGAVRQEIEVLARVNDSTATVRLVNGRVRISLGADKVSDLIVDGDSDTLDALGVAAGTTSKITSTA